MPKPDPITRMKTFTGLADLIVAIAYTNVSWETKYELIFRGDVAGAIYTLDFNLDWVDPDTSYEADVMAFANAVQRKAAEIQTVLDQLQ